MEANNKSPLSPQKYSKNTLVTACIIMAILGFIGGGTFQASYNASQIDSLQSQIADLSNKNKDLSNSNTQWQQFNSSLTDFQGKAQDYTQHLSNETTDLKDALNICDGNAYGTTSNINYYINLSNSEQQSLYYDWGQMQDDIKFLEGLYQQVTGGSQKQ